MKPRLLMILSENHTLIPAGDLKGLVRLAVTAEEAGFDAVMLSEHVVLGPSAGSLGRPANPREYAAPGNQDPAMSWPSSLVMASAVAAVTSRVRIVLGALIAPLRNPVILAKELATLDRLSAGRLVFQPTVSWHRDEYDAIGVPFTKRGRILDEQLEAMTALWDGSPATYKGEFFEFADVYCEPKPLRGAAGPVMWFGGQSVHPRLLARLVRYGSGYHPFGAPNADDLLRIDEAMTAAGRDPVLLERIGGTRARFESPATVADLGDAMASFESQWRDGFTTFCMKPSQHTDDPTEVADICTRMVDYVDRL